MDATQEFFDAIKQGEWSRVEQLVGAHPDLANAQAPDGTSAVLFAAYRGKSDIAKFLASRRDNLNIFEAAVIGDNDRIEKILNEKPELVNAHAPDGFQPLGLAAFFGHLDLVECLLPRGAEVNAASKNDLRVMPLHSAVANKQYGIAATLLARGAEVNAVQQDDFTPLMEAAQNGQLEMVKLLLTYGADVNAKKKDGKTALKLAEEHGHPEVAEYLREQNAKE